MNAMATRSLGRRVDGQLVVSSADVLHERGAGDDHLAVRSCLSPRIGRSRVSAAVIGLDRIVGMVFNAVPRRRHQVLQDSRVDWGCAGDHLDWHHLHGVEGPLEGAAGFLLALRRRARR